jgi:hypothetical protein
MLGRALRMPGGCKSRQRGAGRVRRRCALRVAQRPPSTANGANPFCLPSHATATHADDQLRARPRTSNRLPIRKPTLLSV